MTIAVRLPPEVERRLEQLGTRTGRSKASFAREAIERFLKYHEDEQLAIERLKKTGKRWTLGELEREVDLERSEPREDPFAHFDEWVLQVHTKRWGSLDGPGDDHSRISCIQPDLLR